MIAHTGPALLLALSTSAAAASNPSWAAGLSADRVAWLASVSWMGSKAQGVWVRRELSHQLAVGLEARKLQTPLLTDGHGFELGGSFGFRPQHPWYRPMVSLSGGWSGGVRFDWAAYHGPGWRERAPVERADYRPWYAGLQIEPLTAQVRALEVSTLALDVSQMGWGRALRARVQLLRVGARW
ncbi:MAG: hypothetical protein CL927_01940 [Deltaproteobacteria bacterium]|nr:hypothetical protein [Deltaproteobacteria bacterium]